MSRGDCAAARTDPLGEGHKSPQPSASRAGSSSSAAYPQPCGWCGNPVMDAEGWLLHAHGVCLMLAWIGAPKCFVSVSPDVYEWLTA